MTKKKKVSEKNVTIEATWDLEERLGNEDGTTSVDGPKIVVGISRLAVAGTAALVQQRLLRLDVLDFLKFWSLEEPGLIDDKQNVHIGYKADIESFKPKQSRPILC